MLPFVTRSHHEALVKELRDRLDERAQRIQELDRTLHRLWDIIAKHNWQVQIFDTIPELKPEPEPELTPEEQAVKELEADYQYDLRKAASVARTRPSQLGATMEQVLVKDQLRRANAARPSSRPNPAKEVFDAAKKEAEASVQ